MRGVTDSLRELEGGAERIYADYKKLMQGKDVRKVGVYSYLCDKYGLHSKNTIHTIRRRMEALENEQKQ